MWTPDLFLQDFLKNPQKFFHILTQTKASCVLGGFWKYTLVSYLNQCQGMTVERKLYVWTNVSVQIISPKYITLPRLDSAL